MKTYPLLSDSFVPPVVILANGEYPVHPLPLALLEKASHVVCCDGASAAFVAHGGIPSAIVGDGDSLPSDVRDRFSSCIHSDPDQETNDLTKAVRYCIREGYPSVLILGATGKREDHTLGNISLLADYAPDISVEMVTDYGVFTPVISDARFETYLGQQVSLFAIDPVEVTVGNLRYPIRGRILTSWWQGTLNESTGDYFTVQTSGRLIVYRAYR